MEYPASILTHQMRKLAEAGGDSQALSDEIYRLLMLERERIQSAVQEAPQLLPMRRHVRASLRAVK